MNCQETNAVVSCSLLSGPQPLPPRADQARNGRVDDYVRMGLQVGDPFCRSSHIQSAGCIHRVLTACGDLGVYP